MTNTDWTLIRDRLREDERCWRSMLERADEKDDRGKVGDPSVWDVAQRSHAQTVIALAEAERMMQAAEDKAHDDAIRAKAKATADALRGPIP